MITALRCILVLALAWAAARPAFAAGADPATAGGRRRGIELPEGALRAAPSVARAAGDPATPSRFSVIRRENYAETDVPPGPYRKVWGVFIGVSRYAESSRIPALKNAARDAHALAIAMREHCGITAPVVLSNADATRANLLAKLREIGAESDPADLFVFHFSGHGIGLRDSETGEPSGLLLLHDSAGLDGLLDGDFRGTLDMQALTTMLEEAGVRAKHRMFFLDSCYSGMAAVRAVPRAPVVNSPATALEFMLGRRASYIITAGAPHQLVLDGRPGSEGYGLLSGHLLATLRDPAAQRVPMIRYKDRDYLPMRQFYDSAMNSIPVQARELITRSARGRGHTALEAQSRTITIGSKPGAPTAAPSTTDVPPDEAESPDPGDSSRLAVQLPQEDRPEGDGWVYLPYLAGKSPAPDTPTPTHAEQPAILDPQAWAREVGIRLRAPGYGDRLAHLLRLLQADSPAPASTAGGGAVENPLAVSAEILRRPVISEVSLRRAYHGPEGLDPRGQRMDELAFRASVDAFRRATPGLDWSRLPTHGGRVGDTDEYRIVVENAGLEPIHYYVIAIDSDGIVQWMAPENPTWPSSPSREGSSGPPRLAPGRESRLVIPRDKTSTSSSARAELGYPVVSGSDQQFVLVVCRERWGALEEVLSDVATLASRLSVPPGEPHGAPAGVASVAPFGLPAGFSRLGEAGNGGSVGFIARRGKKGTASPRVCIETKGALLLSTWTLDVVGQGEIEYELTESKGAKARP